MKMSFCSDTAIQRKGSLEQRIFLDSVSVAKSMFEAKSAIIKDAEDLTTQDKLAAFDQASSQYFFDVLTCVCIAGVAIVLLNRKL